MSSGGDESFRDVDAVGILVLPVEGVHRVGEAAALYKLSHVGVVVTLSGTSAAFSVLMAPERFDGQRELSGIGRQQDGDLRAKTASLEDLARPPLSGPQECTAVTRMRSSPWARNLHRAADLSGGGSQVKTVVSHHFPDRRSRTCRHTY